MSHICLFNYSINDAFNKSLGFKITKVSLRIEFKTKKALFLIDFTVGYGTTRTKYPD